MNPGVAQDPFGNDGIESPEFEQIADLQVDVAAGGDGPKAGKKIAALPELEDHRP